ncbi:B1 bradykinin receptor [Paralichthys olivaceus]|uniref:B1 bradykinin receptor n=1 Tax=Paralichthys olivaceus TaxID=8255 RepID=UPI003751D499
MFQTCLLTLPFGNIFSRPMPMEPMKITLVGTLWSENSTTSLPVGPSESPTSADWDVLETAVPPYIFVLCLIGLLFNSFVLAVYAAHRDRLTVAEIYLGNLALADFILLCGLPFWAMYILNDFNWQYGDALCKLVNSIIIINFYTSIFTLVMISIDRYLALVKTMKARWLRQTRYAKVACLILWILGFVLSTPTMIHRKVKFIEDQQTTSCILDFSHDISWKLAHQILLNIVGFALPVLIIVFSSGNIIKALGQRRESIGFHETDDRKATALMCAVTLLFFVCWGPFQIFTLLDTLCDVKVLDEELWFHTLDIGSQISAYLAFLNSALNPLLYVFSGQYFRRKVIAIYRRNRHPRRGSDMTTYQRSVLSTYINRAEQIKPVVIFNVNDQM